LGTSSVANNYRITLIKGARENIGDVKEGEMVAFYMNRDGDVVIRRA